MLKLEIEANEDEVSAKMVGTSTIQELSNTVKAMTNVLEVIAENIRKACGEEVQK